MARTGSDDPVPGSVREHRVDLLESSARVRVRVGGEPLADSRRTLVVHETRHAPVVYFPRDDVRMERLEPSDHRTFCPFKGTASYWSVRAGDRVIENAVWSYEDPLPEVDGLRGRLAFQHDRFEHDRFEQQSDRFPGDGVG